MSDVENGAPKKSRSSNKDGSSAARRQSSSRPQKRVQGQTRTVKMLRLGAASMALIGGGFLALLITVNYQSFRLYDARADAKAQQLAALQSQHDDMERRLQFLQLPKGREQVLLEHGYLKPGQRILLFPAEKTASDTSAPANAQTSSTRSSTSESAAMTTTQTDSKTDLNPTASSESTTASAPINANDGSKPAGNPLSRWWNDVNRASSSSPSTSAAPPTSAPAASAPASAPASIETP